MELGESLDWIKVKSGKSYSMQRLNICARSGEDVVWDWEAWGEVEESWTTAIKVHTGQPKPPNFYNNSSRL